MNKIACFPLFSAVDAAKACRYINGTSLLSVSTAERGAVSSGAALAFSMGWFAGKGAAS
jgi:hypothetical protein